MPKFARDNAVIHYEVSGTGPPLLLLAGIASDGASWAPLLPLLEDAFTLIRIDNRGSGQSESHGPILIDDMAADAAELLARMGIPAVHVLGHSMGAMVGLRLASRHPEMVDRLVAMTATAEPGAKDMALMEEMAMLYRLIPPQRWFSLLFQFLFAPKFFADPVALERAVAAAVAYPFRQSTGDFARQVTGLRAASALDLASVPHKVLAIAAEEDILVPPRAMLASLAGLPGVENVVIQGAGHSAHWDAPGAVAEQVRRFLA